MSETTPPQAAPASPGRRLFLTLLFADLSHSTELAAAMEAEHYAALLATLRSAYQQDIPRFGGTVVRVQGDGVLAMFGYPQAREDDGRRAVEAALQLHQRVSAVRLDDAAGSPLVLSLHSGIHSGLVLVADGDIERGRFELLGPVPNLAARLSAEAQPHQVVVSDETLGPARRYFGTGQPQQLQVRGRETPLRVVRIDARAGLAPGADNSARQVLAPFIGRQAELEELQSQLRQTLAGGPRIVAVAGAPGIGKTRLIEQLLGRAALHGWRVLRGFCERDLDAEPLQPFAQMLQPAAAPAPPQAGAYAELLAGLALDNPLLLFIDDWQWADDASRQVLAALQRQTQRRLLVLLSTRDSTAPWPLVNQTLQLEPLNAAEAALVIATRLPGADPFVADQIARRAGGNPLYIEELCHSAARGSSHASGRPDRLQSGPGWLSQLIESRVQHLAPAQAELVRTAAVIGNVVPGWLLQRISGGGPDHAAQLQALAEQDFIFPAEHAGSLRFKHGITRDVIYESVGLQQRQRLHLQVAQALLAGNDGGEHEEALEALAHHFEAGGDAVQAARYAERAGDKALAASALDRARLWFRAALAALDRLPLHAEMAQRWVAIVQRLGLVCVFDPSRSELALARRAVQLAERFGTPAELARARYWLAYFSYAMGDTLVAIEHGELALQQARGAGEPTLATQIVATLGEAHAAAGQYTRALELLDTAIAVKRAHRSGRRTNVGLAYSLVCRAYALGDRGSFGQAEQCFADALDCIAGVTHEIAASTHGWRAAVLLWQGRWHDALAAATESGRIAQATRSLAQLSIARAMAGYAGWMLTRQPQALQDIVEATAWLEPRESGLFRSLNHGWLAEGHQHAGRRDRARQHAALALRRSRQCDLIGVAMACRAMARDTAGTAAAQRYLQRAYTAARLRESAHEKAVTQLCEAQIAAQPDARTLALLHEATAAFESMQMPWHLQQAQALLVRFKA